MKQCSVLIVLKVLRHLTNKSLNNEQLLVLMFKILKLLTFYRNYHHAFNKAILFSIKLMTQLFILYNY